MQTKPKIGDVHVHQPSDTLVHLGAGCCKEPDTYLALQPQRLLLVEADPQLTEALQLRTTSLSQVQVSCEAAEGQPDPATFCRYNLPGAGSLNSANGLLQLAPGLKTVEQLQVEAVSQITLLQPLQLQAQQKDHLIINLPGEALSVLRALQKATQLHLFHRLKLHCDREPRYEGSEPSTPIIQWQQGKGFDLLAEDESQDPGRPCWTLQRNTLQRRNRDLQGHPDGAKIAFLVAAAHYQNNEMANAKQFIQLAQNWGCSKTFVSLILITGVHNTVGRVAYSYQQEQKALRHFDAAVAMGSPYSDVCLLAKARNDFQTQLIRAFRKDPQLEAKVFRSGSRIYQCGETSLVRPKGTKKSNKVIVVAGMRHSGSTALFNIVRLTLLEAGFEIVSCYSDNRDCVKKISESDHLGLIKIHEMRDDVVEMASVVLTTIRDLRDSVASAVRRKFPILSKLGGPVEYAKYNRSIHDAWLHISDFRFVYEEFISNPIDCIRNIAAIIGVTGVNVEKIYDLVIDLPHDDYENTLLSPSHITDPSHNLSYLDSLDVKTIKEIEAHNSHWLNMYGYEISTNFE